MKSRKELDREFSKSPVIGSEQHEGLYNYIHPHRLRVKGLKLEARVWLKSKTRNDKPKPFVIYGRPRSGTTLMVRLLDQIPGVRCEGELLHDIVLRPTTLLRNLPKRAGSDVRAYGIKLLSYQLMDVQRVLRPLAFFDKLLDMDYAVIHLTRNTWDQTMSLVKAHQTGLYFGELKEQSSLTLDPARFAIMLRWNETMLAYEQDVMAHVPHVHVDYDTGLKDPAQRETELAKICDALGLEKPMMAVEANLRPTGGRFGPQVVENMDAILQAVQDAGLTHLIPKKLLS